MPVLAFQIGSPPLLNRLLYHNSPGQKVADKLFADLGRTLEVRPKDDLWDLLQDAASM
jgi:hypothetical protein